MLNAFKVKKGLFVQGSGSVITDIQGSQGQLFSIVDSLSGSLMSVNNISGIPVLEVFSDNRVLIGTFGQEAIKVNGNSALVSGSFSGSFQGNGSQLTNIPSGDSFPFTGSAIITGSLNVIGTVTTTGNIIPFTGSIYNLGSETNRWNIIYTSDLSLRNDVGDWTIVEGEDDLFLYNNRKGKVYKFNITEVDPLQAPSKKE